MSRFSTFRHLDSLEVEFFELFSRLSALRRLDSLEVERLELDEQIKCY